MPHPNTKSRSASKRTLITFFLCILYTHGAGQEVNLTLTSSDVLEGEICSDVHMICTVEDIGILRWFFGGVEGAKYIHTLNNTFPPPRELEYIMSLPGVNILVINAVEGSTLDGINATSTLTSNVSSLQQFSGQVIQCGTLESEGILVGNITVRGSPSSILKGSCSLFPSSGGLLCFSLQWSPLYNMQNRVERYNVAVTPDPSSCSSDQVPPSENYSCSGLDPETSYTITVSAINCGDQEGEIMSYIVQPQILVPMSPQNLNASIIDGLLAIKWNQPIYAECPYFGATNYTLFLKDSTGMVVEERAVSSDSCRSSSCSLTFKPSTLKICRVSISAINEFRESNSTDFYIVGSGSPRLTSTNISLLGFAVVLCLIGVITAAAIVIYRRKGITSVCGVVVVFIVSCVGISVVLWVAVAFQVQLQKDTCDTSWQAVRNHFIIGSFVITFLLFTAVITVSLLYLCRTKRKGQSKDLSMFEVHLTNKAGKENGSAGGKKVMCNTMLKRNRYFKAFNSIIKNPQERMVAWLPEHRKWNDQYLNNKAALKVFFMNNLPTSWHVTNIKSIMQILDDSWTGCFTLGNAKTNHIRVIFEDNDFSNWAAIGVPAVLINHKKPTMSLNFRNMNEQEIRATVVHQFGHALGLGHILMKPGDWEAIKQFVNVEEMMHSYGAENEEEFEIQWTGKGMSETAVYSEESVMRYSIDLAWLRDGVPEDNALLNTFKKHANLVCDDLQDDLYLRDRETLRLLKYGNPALIRTDDLEYLTTALADSWEKIGNHLGIKNRELRSISAMYDENSSRLKKIWEKWLHYDTGALKFPSTWNGLYFLLRESGHEDAARIFYANRLA